MLEAAAVPVLLKAVDWIFGEGSKILEESRKRRQAETEDKEEGFEKTVLPSEAITSKDDAVQVKISEAIWRDSEKQIEHLLSLLEIHTRNYRLAQEKYAQWGSALVPPVIVNELVNSENEIAKITQELKTSVSGVFKKPVTTLEIEKV